MDLVINIIVALCAAIIGAILSMILPNIVRYRKYRKRRDIIGTWYSIYQPYQHVHRESKRWINEEVEVDIHDSKFRFRNRKNENTDCYIAEGTISQGTYLIGNWVSVEKDAQAHSGAFMLTMVPKGSILYGYFSGPKETHEKIYGAWVLAKNKENLEEGLRLLNLGSLKLETNSS